MGCCGSRENSGAASSGNGAGHRSQPSQGATRQQQDILLTTSGNKPLRRDVEWKATEKSPFTLADLQAKRDAFWDTAPKYEGRPEIWAALRAACESPEDQFAQLVVDSANISVPTGLLSEGAYDELGNRYVVPDFCFVDPVNLAVAVAGGGGGGGQEEEVEGEKRRGSDATLGKKEEDLLADDSDAPQIELTLRLSTNKDVHLTCSENTSVQQLKRKLIRDDPELGESKFRVLCMGRVLEDGTQLKEATQSVKMATSAAAKKELVLQVMISPI